MTLLFFNLSSLLLPFSFNLLLLWKEKHNNVINRRLFLFARSHETCDPCLFDQENFKHSENKRTENHETWSTLLNKQREPKPPTFLLGKNQRTLKLSIFVLVNREIENNQPFLLAKDSRTSNNQNIS